LRDKKRLIVGIAGIVLVILLLCFTILLHSVSKEYKSVTGVVRGWNHLNGFGYNIFFANNKKDFFLHGDDWRFTKFLESLELNKTYTFVYHVYVEGDYSSCVGPTTWNHIMEVRDCNDNVLFKSDLWQEG